MAPFSPYAVREDQMAPFPRWRKALRFPRYDRTSSQRTLAHSLAAEAARPQERPKTIQPPDRELQLAPIPRSVLAPSRP